MGNNDQDIECGSCGKKLNRARFSNTAVRKYQERVHYSKSRRTGGGGGGGDISLPNCRDCTGGSRDEMFCQGCQKTYSLDKFSKAQRQKSDNAKCWTCLQESEDRVADIKDAIQEQEFIEKLENPSIAPTGAWGTESLRDTLPSFRRVGVYNSAASNTGRTASNADSDAVWIHPDQSYRAISQGLGSFGAGRMRGGESDSEQTQSTHANRPATLGRQSNTDWNDSTPIELAHPANRRQVSVTSSDRFAKQKAVLPDARSRAEEQLRREHLKRTQGDEDGDEDDESGQSDSDDDWDGP